MSQRSALRFFTEVDADPAALAGQSVAVLGYGNLGRSLALNLRDSGLPVLVGNVDDGYRQAAAADGFEVADIGPAAAAADVVLLLLPDEVIPGCFAATIGPALRPGTVICFASGYVLAFGLVEPSPEVDVLLLAPRMVGAAVRQSYLDKGGFLSYLSVEQNASGRAEQRLLALASAAGSLRRGALGLTARQEALLDLLVEQTFGAYVGVALQLAFHVGVAAGLPAEAMVAELYMSGEMAHTFQSFADLGFFPAISGHGPTAMYGGFLRTQEIDAAALEAGFRATLDDIQAGRFAATFQEEQAAGYPTLTLIQQLAEGDNPITAAERQLRAGLTPDQH